MKRFLSDILNSFGSKAKRPGGSPAVMSTTGRELNIFDVLTADCVRTDLQAETKDEAIQELVDILGSRRKLEDAALCLSDVLAREKIMSTGMQHGIALPHAKTDGTRTLRAAVGISRKGIDFEYIDGEPSKLFILVISPKRIAGPHIRFLAAVGAILKAPERRDRVLKARSAEEVVAILRESIPS